MSKIKDLDNVWLGLGDTSEIDTFDPLCPLECTKDYPGLQYMYLMQQPDYLTTTAKQLLNIDLLPEQGAILEELWTRPFPMFIASRGFGKSWLLAVYCMLKMILTPPAKDGGAGAKIVVAGAAFRQSKIIFEYMETLWRNTDLLRDIADNNSGPSRDVDRCTMRLNSNWTMAVPIGDGQKIRGLRANTVVADEFAAIPPNIYETVLQGFAVVAANPVEQVKMYRMRDALKKAGKWSEKEEQIFQSRTGNQIIISGTADFAFNHFADYWRKYRDYVRGVKNKQALEKYFEDGVLPEDFDPSNYSVTRIPFELVPKGFMDDKVITRAKATVHSGVYNSEYGAVFTTDSNGFFRRSLIESCVTSETNPIKLPSGEVMFDAKTRGNHKLGYIFGIDPASEADNFSIVVLEIHPDHRRIVYVWTTNRKDFKARQKAGLTDVADFYGFCARKIRDLMVTFPPAIGHPFGASIGMDAQGGGIAVMEALHDPDKLKPGEILIWPIINPDKEADTDINPGLHIVDMVQFAKYEWTSEANHGLRKDLEDKVLLFPRFDPISLDMAIASDKVRADVYKEKHHEELVIYDSLEDCVMEIEELKNELTSIVVTRTGTGVGGRDRWDTPEVKKEGGKKGRMRKDRYSSLVIANMLARQLQRAPSPTEYEVIGGFTRDIAHGVRGPLYGGPEWFSSGMEKFLSKIKTRGV